MSKTSTASANLLDELQAALAHGTVARRVETLRRVTDLFLNAADDYANDQVDVFDDVFQYLIHHIEASAKILLANRLAPIANAPPQTIQILASDDLIDVAAPVLSQSVRLDDDILIANARRKSQAHLLAISTRRILSDALTEVLIERGDNDVIQSTVNNPGARFSEKGYDGLVMRAERDDNIATYVGLMSSLPRHRYLKILTKASASVRARLDAANPQMSGDVSAAVSEATRRARSAPAAIGQETTIAHGLVGSLYKDGRLDERQVMAFATSNKFDETNAAIACLASIPVLLAETMMVESPTEGLLILAKVADLSWPTVHAIIHMRAGLSGAALPDLEESRLTFERLRVTTAQQVLRFHKMQQTASSAPAA